MPVDDVEAAAQKGGATPQQARAIADDYGAAQLDALRLALGAVATAALLSLWFTRHLPSESLGDSAAEVTDQPRLLAAETPPA